MYEFFFLWVLSFVFIILAVIQDLKTREIDNWLSFSLIIFAIGFRFFFSLFQGDFEFFFCGLIGFGISFILGNVFYYTKIFAGGDAKLMISLGVILAPAKFSSISSNFFDFILIFLLIGFSYTIITSIFLCIKNFKNFKKEFSTSLKKNKKKMCLVILLSLILSSLGFFEITFFFLGILTFLTSYLYLYSKAVDESCMVRKISSKNLREGDWLYSNVHIGKNVIKAKWDGVTKKEIKEISKRFNHVRIREGIPFSPVFLISFIIFVILQILKIKLWESFW